ncbi:MAG TPA: ribosome biogenesis GTPase YlqF, partial [Thermoanaerobacterales bacterium]|nr:ribosome biogenesis GTPase YlqF [Thermoanaerobacterales bacterium]
MEIHWYPGHMAKTRRMIKENLPLIDTVVELVDARAPMSTHLPDIFQIIGSKRLVVVLNKADLADPNATRLWLNKFRELGLTAIDIDTPKRLGIKKLVDMLHETKTKGPSSHFRPMRCAILGVPNVGKSSLINQLARRKGAKTGDKPGVTKGKMWLKVDRTLELLDTPGILWPKFEEKSTAIKLALIGSIKDELVNIEELSQILI